MRGHSAPCRIKTGTSSHVVGRKSDDREAEPSLGYSAAWWISQRLGNSRSRCSTDRRLPHLFSRSLDASTAKAVRLSVSAFSDY
jgi:hypothetical protein